MKPHETNTNNPVDFPKIKHTMNERIRLPAQEWLGYDPEKGDIHGYTFEQMREFAESIIRECLEQIDKIRDGCDQDGEVEQALGADWAGLAVARHFGVEE